MIDDLLPLFEEVRQSSPSQWMARCPCSRHEDRTASLAISRKHDRWLLFCHAGCDTEAVVEAVGLTMRDLGPATTVGTSPEPTVYRYVDEQGAPLFEVVRSIPKRFFQRLPDGTLRIGKVRRVLYRLPQLVGLRELFLPEGERDVDELWAHGLAATTNAGGAGKWRDEYAVWLKAHGVERVIVLPDNDPPGIAHAMTVASSCHAAGLHVIVLYLPGLPDKGDVSDYLQTHGKDDLLMLVRGTPAFDPNRPAAAAAIFQLDSPPRKTDASLAKCEAVFRRWINGDNDPHPTRAVLAVYLANRRLHGDPVWLLIVGGSGTGKTERLIPLAALPDVMLESSITGPGALLSGTKNKEKAKDASGGLLRKVPAGGGVLVLKDFTSIMDMHRDARAEVLAAFREIYDGRWDRSIGTDGGRTVTWTGHLGLIAGCTTAYDSAFGVTSTMGTRFLLIRLQDDPAVASSVLAHVGHESEMRAALRAAVVDFLSSPPGTAHILDDAVRTALAALGAFVARARSPVERDRQGEISLVMDAEAPTRIVKMLAQIWRAAGLMTLNRSDAWTLVKRIGLDSIPKLRGMVLRFLMTVTDIATTTAIAAAVDHPTSTTRRALQDLTAHGVVCRYPAPENSGKADQWSLSPKAQQWIAASSLPVPDLSADLQTPSDPEVLPYRTKNSRDDKTGKGPINPDRNAYDEARAEAERRRDAGDARFRQGWK